MGIIILPILIAALGLTIQAIIDTIKQFRKGTIGVKEIIFGLSITLIIYGLICLSYIMEGRAWGLSPAFRIPIFMIFIPFGFYFITRPSTNKTLKYFSTLVMISVGITGILSVLFNNLIFELLDILGVGKYY